MRLFLINKNKLLSSGSVFIFLNKTHVVVSLIFLQQNPSGTTIPKSSYSNSSSMCLIKKNGSTTKKENFIGIKKFLIM